MNLYKLHSKPEELDHHDAAHEHVPALVWEKYQDQPTELKKREKILAKDAKTAYWYARQVLKGPFPAGEATIAKVSWYTYSYAEFLKGPFPAGEEAIAKISWSAYLYALNVMKKPFPAGEEAIAKDANYAYKYARGILGLAEKEAKAWSKHENCKTT